MAIELGDGDVLRNQVVTESVRPRGSGWKIENCAFTGHNGRYVIHPAETDPNGVSEIKGCYIAPENPESGHVTGILIDTEPHVGRIDVKNTYITRCSDNGLYGDSAAKTNAARLHVEACKFVDNNISNLRLGLGCTANHIVSYFDGNTPTADTGAFYRRAVYNSYRGNINEPTVMENFEVDGRPGEGLWIADNSDGQYDNHWIIRNGTLIPENVILKGASSYESQNVSHTGPIDETYVDGYVPLSEDAAVSGSYNSGTPDGPGTGPTDPEPTEGTEFAILTPSGGETIEYTFVADGPVTKTNLGTNPDTGNEIAAGGNDTITDNGDGTYTVTGSTANGYGDGYLVDGYVTEWSDNGASRSFTWGGSSVTREELLNMGETSPPPEDGDPRVAYGIAGALLGVGVLPQVFGNKDDKQ